MNLKVKLTKKYKTSLGSQDCAINDGEDLTMTWMYGTYKEGFPAFKKNQATRGEITIKLDSLEELIKKDDL